MNGKEEQSIHCRNRKTQSSHNSYKQKIYVILIAQLSEEDTVVLGIVHIKQKYFAASMYFDHEERIENKIQKMD
jgi:hypothetical protein